MFVSLNPRPESDDEEEEILPEPDFLRKGFIFFDVPRLEGCPMNWSWGEWNWRGESYSRSWIRKEIGPGSIPEIINLEPLPRVSSQVFYPFSMRVGETLIGSNARHEFTSSAEFSQSRAFKANNQFAIQKGNTYLCLTRVSWLFLS